MAYHPQILDIKDTTAVDAAIAHIRHHAIIVQLPTVFALFAMPNRDGVAMIDDAKDRKPGKNYGTTAGDVGRFFGMSSNTSALAKAVRQAEPDHHSRKELLGRISGSFLRIKVGPASLETPTVRGGSHQSLLLDGLHGQFFDALERRLIGLEDPSLYGGHAFAAPICSSCNISGDPGGSITSFERAHDFAVRRAIPLIIRSQVDSSEMGSFPVFELSDTSVIVHRSGPRVKELKKELEALLPEKSAEDMPFIGRLAA
jgi:tRNA A37 threonylcarbamoyladenosine synthetase subunit TsaC/SUA5/YrdC